MVLNRRFQDIPATPDESRRYPALSTKLTDIIFRISGHLCGLFRRYVFLFFYEYLVHTCSIAISRLVWKSYTQLSIELLCYKLTQDIGVTRPAALLHRFPDKVLQCRLLAAPVFKDCFLLLPDNHCDNAF